MAVETSFEPDFSVRGAPERLFSLPVSTALMGTWTGFQYDFTADGRRFIVNAQIEEAAASSVRVVMNWQQLVGQR